MNVGVVPTVSNSLCKDLGLIEGQTYVIGREGDICLEGHIYINSPSVSRQHAAIIIKNGRIYLRDLNSTNGTYLIENDSLVDFDEGYVKPNQPIVLGKVKCTIQSLLAVAGAFTTSKNITSGFEDTTKLVIPTVIGHYETSDPENKTL